MRACVSSLLSEDMGHEIAQMKNFRCKMQLGHPVDTYLLQEMMFKHGGGLTRLHEGGNFLRCGALHCVLERFNGPNCKLERLVGGELVEDGGGGGGDITQLNCCNIFE